MIEVNNVTKKFGDFTALDGLKPDKANSDVCSWSRTDR